MDVVNFITLVLEQFKFGIPNAKTKPDHPEMAKNLFKSAAIAGAGTAGAGGLGYSIVKGIKKHGNSDLKDHAINFVKGAGETVKSGYPMIIPAIIAGAAIGSALKNRAIKRAKAQLKK